MSRKTSVLILACAISVFTFLASSNVSAYTYGKRFNYGGRTYTYIKPHTSFRLKRIPRSRPRAYSYKRSYVRPHYRRLPRRSYR